MPFTCARMLGEDLDAAIEHFQAKIAAHDDPMSAIRSAQVLVGLLVRHERYREAVQVSLEHLGGIARQPARMVPRCFSSASSLAIPNG